MQIDQILEELEALNHEQQDLLIRKNTLEQKLMQYMLKQGITSLDCKIAKLKLEQSRGKSKRKALAEAPEAKKLKASIEAEQALLNKSNADEIYALQSQITLLQGKLNTLQSNNKILSIRLDLAKLEQKIKQELQDNPETVALSIKFANSSDILDSLDGEMLTSLLQEGQELAKTTGKAITKALLRHFVRAFYANKYGALSLPEAWELRKQEHISYCNG